MLPRIVVARLRWSITERFNGRVDIGALSFGLDGRLHASDVPLLAKDDRVVIRIAAIRAKVGIWKAIGGTYDVVAIIERPTFYLHALEAAVDQVMPPRARFYGTVVDGGVIFDHGGRTAEIRNV